MKSISKEIDFNNLSDQDIVILRQRKEYFDKVWDRYCRMQEKNYPAYHMRLLTEKLLKTIEKPIVWILNKMNKFLALIIRKIKE